jgi:hypothetical protein
MRRKLVGIVAVMVPLALSAAPAQKVALTAPASIHAEHEEIHEALEALTKAAGPVGAAAQELASTLHPHFVREEEIALPPLGLLRPLAAGKTPDGMPEAVVMSDTLRKEMPRMLEEHTKIRSAVEKLQRVAREDRHAGGEAFASKLAMHAQMEEEVLYPAAILVGELIRGRTAKR